MKLIFKQQSYQAEATQSIVDCFTGQTKGDRKDIVGRKDLIVEEIFSNKRLDLTDNELLKNINELQKEQGLKLNKVLDKTPEGLNLTIEMETGTGKTYVYIKTMYELNKRYGWSKFIIMVPSIAIREGVHKSLEITADHFQELYGKKIRFSIYNTQNKSNIINIKNFAVTSNIEVMIMNYQAFATKSKESRKIYQKLDSIQSEKPIDIIKRARPILIIDEPQRFGKNAEAKLSEFDPLFIMRYSATHKKDKEFNKVYRLDAIDAYNQKLVKRINVKGIEVIGNSGTNSYLFLDRINISSKNYPTATIELEVKQNSGIKKVLRKIEEKDDLFSMGFSNELKEYKGFIVKEINGLKNKVTFTNGVEIGVSQSLGEVDEEHVRRIQIRETIKSHLEKEQVLFNRGIKVLSLFFIDEVAKYRVYDATNNQLNGEYADIFEQEYQIAIDLLDLEDGDYKEYLHKHTVNDIHKGYFSVDKKGKMINSKEKRGEAGSDDVSAYELIMKRKERLLSFEEPTRFIFSHSALREGWDNPNVFQICTLKHSQSEVSKRQEIGRGLRICVNEKGERMDHSVLEGDFFNLNTLTVVASESYDSFAKALQNEIVESLSDRPIKLTTEVLIDRVLKNSSGEKFIFDQQSSMDLIFSFREKGYVDKEYKITEKLIQDIETDKIELPEELTNFKDSVCELMTAIHTTANFKATSNEKEDNVNEVDYKPNQNFIKKEFQDLWNKIKVKTVYEVDFDSDKLIENSIKSIDKKLKVKKIFINITVGEQKDKIDQTSLKTGESMKQIDTFTEDAESLLGLIKYDLVSEIAKETRLLRKTVAKILNGISPDKFTNYKSNPENFIKEVAKLINIEKASTLVNNIVYTTIDDTFSDEIFTIKTFKGSLSENISKVEKHIYDYVKTDSLTEKEFAKRLESGEVLVYAKLPPDFKIPTPVGEYNPDWAIVFDNDRFKYVYFIAETKGTMETTQLKEIETRKINYAKKHFEALGHKDIKYDVVQTYDDLRDKVI